jgi:hypothetical protein
MIETSLADRIEDRQRVITGVVASAVWEVGRGGQPLNLNLVELEFQGAHLSSAVAEKVGILTLSHPNFCLRVFTPAWAGNANLP